MSIDKPLLAAKTEALATLPIAAMIFALTCACLRPSIFTFGLTGFFAALAFLCKQPAILMIGAALLVATTFPNSRLRYLASTVAGAMLPILTLLGFFSAIDALDALRWQLWDSPAIYASIDRIPLSRRLLRIVTYTEEYSRLFPLFAMLALIGLVMMIHHLTQSRHFDSRLRVILAWGSVGVFGYLASLAGADLYLNYFILALPGATLLASWALDELANANLGASDAIKVAACASLMTGFVMGGVLSLKDPIKGVGQAGSPSRPVVERIKEVSSRGERIYVWGYSPDLYLQSERVPASRYVLTDMLVGFFGEGTRQVNANERRVLAEPGAWPNFLDELKESSPAIFVDASETDLFGQGSFGLKYYPDLNAWLVANYEVDSTFTEGGGRRVFRLYRRRT